MDTEKGRTDCELFDQLTIFFYSPDRMLGQDTVKFYLEHERTCPKPEHNRGRFQECFGASPDPLKGPNVVANMQERAKRRRQVLSGTFECDGLTFEFREGRITAVSARVEIGDEFVAVNGPSQSRFMPQGQRGTVIGIAYPWEDGRGDDVLMVKFEGEEIRMMRWERRYNN